MNAATLPAGTPPRPFDDIGEFGRLLSSFPQRRPHLDASLDEVDAHSAEPPLTPEQREVQLRFLFGYLVEALMVRQTQARASELVPIPARAAARRDEEEADAELLLRAMQSLPPTSEAGATIRAFYAHFVETLLPQIPLPAWNETDLASAPHRTHNTQIARDIEKFAAQIGWSELSIPRRLVDPAIDRLIGRLAEFWLALTGQRPTTPDNSSAESYRSGFATFVARFWPALEIGPPPSNKSIARALARSDF